jgi:hypothetical protein
MWGYPWTLYGAMLASAGFLVGSVIGDLKHSLFTLILIAASYPIYRLAVKKTPTLGPAIDVPAVSQAKAD